jgi:hypothetical protein
MTPIDQPAEPLDEQQLRAAQLVATICRMKDMQAARLSFRFVSDDAPATVICVVGQPVLAERLAALLESFAIEAGGGRARSVEVPGIVRATNIGDLPLPEGLA